MTWYGWLVVGVWLVGSIYAVFAIATENAGVLAIACSVAAWPLLALGWLVSR